jgi:UDPglucose 6-dehydrogenase
LHNSLGRFGPIGIIGVGAVGGAVRHYLESRLVAPRLFDPGKRLGSLAEVNEADLVFICVPTPYAAGRGFDDSAVAEVIGALAGRKTVVIKSTVLPGTTRRFQERFPQHRVLFNPEFLREVSANADFLAPDRQIVGICGDDHGLAADLLAILPRAPHASIVAAEAAELTKYATNAFLAMKVVFANELYDLCAALSVDYEDVKHGLKADDRIGASHLEVHDAGYRGYGGKCLPKDVASLLDLAESMGVPLGVLQAVHEANARLKAPAALNGHRPGLPIYGQERAPDLSVKIA